MNQLAEIPQSSTRVQPACQYFGQCGGCVYQDMDYARELSLKQGQLASLMAEQLGFSPDVEAVVPSPDPYHYRHRLDLTIRKRRDGFMLGFQHPGKKTMLEVEACPIARKEVSSFIPELKSRVIAGWKENYRNANLVVKTGQDGRVLWGGMGRRSLEVPEDQYLWTEIHGKKIFYSLDTFFQANLSILPGLMDRLAETAGFDAQTFFLDLYAGVGLFGVYFADRCGQTIMVEDSETSVRVMGFNARYHGLAQNTVYQAKVEDVLQPLLVQSSLPKKIAIVDPPRKGLHPRAVETLAEARNLTGLFYLSCNPETLVRDLKVFLARGWTLSRVVPFDFFPKTKHLETLVYLKP